MEDNQFEVIESAVAAALLPLESRLAEIQTQQRNMNESIVEGKKVSFPKKLKLAAIKDKDDVTSDKLDPVTTGDLIYLKNVEGGESGYLIGDQAYKRCGMQSQGSGEALNFDDYVFRVCPMLSYRYANEAEALQTRQRAQKLKKAASNGSSSNLQNKRPLTRQVSNLSDDWMGGEVSLDQRVITEKEANAHTLQRVLDGRDKEVVIFGAICQLQHVKSGLFLSVREEAAPFDPDCRALCLEEGSSASYLRVMPCYRAQTEGSATYYTHSIVLESGKYQGMHIHTSAVVYDKIIDTEDPLLPKCLRTGSTFEANVSAHPSVFIVYKYGRFEESDKPLLKTSNPFRLYHPQGESFILASCDQQKDLRGATREDNVPLHIPYLKAMEDIGSDPDPSNPFNHNAKGVWCFEPLHRSTQQCIPWNSPIRVRHVPSGLYLAIDTSKPIDMTNRATEANEIWYTTYLVEDGMGPNQSEFADISFLSIPKNMIFYISSADRLFASHIPRGDISLRLEHHLIEEGFKQVLYLGNTEQRKPKKIGNNNNNNNNGGSGGISSLDLRNTMFADLYGQSGLSLVKALKDDVKTKQLSNFEVEHISIFAACVQAQCIDNVSTPLHQEWLSIYNDMKSWVLVALCDPDASSLAAMIVELFATKSVGRDMVVKDELLLPSLKLCFPQGGGAGDPICESVFGGLLRRLANVSPSHHTAVIDLLNNVGTKKFGSNSPLAIILADLE